MGSFMTNLAGPDWKDKDLNSNPRAEARVEQRATQEPPKTKKRERDDEQKTQEPSSLEGSTTPKTNKRLKLLPPLDPSFERMKGIAQRAFPTLKPDILNDESQLRQFPFAQDRIRLSK